MKTILVVDDLSAAQLFVRETLESKGYETLGATNGDKAYEILTSFSQRVNLILTDYHMPESSGLDLIQKINKNPNLKNIPVIILSAETNPDIIKQVEQIGINSWIKKPYRSEVLIKEIEAALSHNP